MSTNETSMNRGWYMHISREESQQLKGRIVAAIAKHPNDDNMHAVLDGEQTTGDDATEKATSAKKANRQLYGLLIDQIKNPQIVAYLQEHHENKGVAALDYIMGCFGGTDDNKLEAADNRYKQIERDGIPAGATPDEANALLTEMSTLRSSLNAKDSYKISNMRLSRDLVRMVRMRGPAYRDELRHQKDKFGEEQLENVVVIAGILDGLMRNVASQEVADAEDEKSVKVLWARKTRDGKKDGAMPMCDFCGVQHFGKCYAKMLCEGCTPEKWDTMPAEQRKRIAERAEKKKPGCTTSINVLVCALSARTPNAKTSSATFEMLVDTQAAPGHEYHFIKDKELMCHYDTIEGGQPITGVGSAMVIHNIGTAMFRDAKSGEVFQLSNCLFDPQLPENLINPSFVKKQGGVFDSINQRIIAPGGKTIDLTEHWTFTVQSVKHEVAVPVHRASTVQRGSHGKLHIQVDGLRGKKKVEFDLTSARYNNPSLERMRSMRRIADGVSPIVEKANEVNTAGVTRMLADVPTDAPRDGSTPPVSRSGERTCIDLWKAPCKSLEGNVCMNSAYDSYSTNFEVFPLKAKSQAPRSTDQYFRQAKTRGVDIDRGGVLYRDNEIVLNSAKMNEVAVAHNQTNKTSIEYEPTGNAGVESVFRILPHEMRKNAIRSGMPDEFWDYNAIDCAELLAATRCREGPDGTKMSVGEKFDGKRPSLSKRRVWGCLVVAKKYPTWIEGKLDDRGVAGVNLGRSRTQPGYCVWTPEYGVFVSKHVVFYETEFPFLDGTFALQRRSTGGGAATGGGFAPTTEQTATEDDNDSDDNNNGGGGGGGDDDDDEDDDDDDDDEGVPELVARDDADGEDDYGGDGGDGLTSFVQRGSRVEFDQNGDSDGDSTSGPGTGGDNKYDDENLLLDDEDSEQSSAEISTTHTSDHEERSDSTPYANVVRVMQLAAKDPAQVMLSAVKKIKKEREQREKGIPPPWVGLNNASEDIKKIFMEAEMKEINGILDTESAYEVKVKNLQPGEKIYRTLTLRGMKENGPKKGQAKVRVCVDKGPPGGESHSPTMQMTTLRALLSVLAAKRAKGAAGDFPQALEVGSSFSS